MTRKQFIQSHGATCLNWYWSWSFVNDTERFVIFGAWDINEKDQLQMILDAAWQGNRRGRKPLGYDQAREHIRLIEEKGYCLMTFPMEYSDAHRNKDEKGPSKI